MQNSPFDDLENCYVSLSEVTDLLELLEINR